MSIRPPVIVIGMHRSGTSMVMRLLEELGVFAGKNKDHNNEAFFFLGLNDWLLRQSGGAWDHPEPISHLLANAEVRPLATDYLRHLTKTPHVTGYLGWEVYLKYRSLQKIDFAWGWKDPRNTYTLPIWMDIFPDAKVIHVYRHGVDVASSLKFREEKLIDRAAAVHRRRKALYWLRPKRGGFTSSPRCTSLEGGFSLWEAYMEEADKRVSRMEDRAMTLRYEDFLTEPRETLSLLADFCKLPVENGKISAAAGRVRKDRAYAYLDSPELRTFADRVAGRLAEKGY